MSGERCAERPGTGMLLWQHEYYFVIEKYNGGPPKPYIYQALEFRKGSDLPEIEKENMTRKQLRETWVLGVAYVLKCYYAVTRLLPKLYEDLRLPGASQEVLGDPRRS